ncbi:MAG: 4-(cytidine 5'-diphospho)-2-C-methyl-D-erythritol kinase [Caulobacteraceae bacterium]
MIEIFAPAKVNLDLHVGALQEDGYHPVDSLIVFADVGDRLSFTPAEMLSLEVTGPFAGDAPADDGNLVLRAVRAVCEQAGIDAFKQRIVLDKQIPAGAGLGGGSSDAGAALVALGAALPGLPQKLFDQVASDLGSDVPACLAARPLIARGRGEQLSLVDGLPALSAVLVHPARHVSTARVFAAFDRAPPPPERRRAELAAGRAPDLIASLSATANDLTAAALEAEPVIGEVLTALRNQPETRLARMSGSGSGCFALCDDPAAATALAKRLSVAHPEWWVRACNLGTPPWRMRMGERHEIGDRGARPDTVGGSAGHGRN